MRVPKQPAGTTVAVEEFARRHGDFALTAVFGAARLAGDGTIADVRLTVAGAGATLIRAEAAEQLLTGWTPNEELVRAAATAAAAATDPTSDVHAPADYRRTLARVLTRRCLDTIFPLAERSLAA